jgi:hypothetical protein
VAYPGIVTSPAWVAGQPGAVSDQGTLEAEALRRVGESVVAEAAGDDSRSRLLTAAAERLLGGAALREIYRLILNGTLPEMGSAGWDRLIEMARSGDIAITTVVSVRPVEAARDAEPPPAGQPDLSEPGALMDNLREMGLLAR